MKRVALENYQSRINQIKAIMGSVYQKMPDWYSAPHVTVILICMNLKKISSQKVIVIFVPAANISYGKISSDKLWINSL